MIVLSNRTLAELPAEIGRPRYDRGTLKPGIVHFGVGNFHRAHQACYLDDLFNVGRDHDWAIVGASMRQYDETLRAALAGQDWLTTVVEQEDEYLGARVTGPMVDYLTVGDAGAIAARLCDPAIRIVSLTVTEGGYYLDAKGSAFDVTHPDIVADAGTPDAPRTVFGLMLAALRQRRARGTPPFTVMSCDNLPGNGSVTRRTLAGLARLSDAKFADWIESEVAFPSSMVDRITPITSDRFRQELRDQFGISDAWPVFCERFRQWVVEDHFPTGRPSFEEVGVQCVADVAPFEHMKLRILNGGHAALAYPAALLGIELVDQAIADPQLRVFLDKLEREEIIPTVPPVPGTDLGDYFALIKRRFADRRVADPVLRVCFDGSSRQPKFILPSALDRINSGKNIEGLAIVSAAWARYCAGQSEDGRDLPATPADPDRSRLGPLAKMARNNPAAWLTETGVFGGLAERPAYVQAFTAALSSMWAHGVRGTLARYLGRNL